VKLYGAVAAEYLVRLRRHQAAGLPDPEAHRLASLETCQRRRAVLEVLEKAKVSADDPTGLSLLAAHGWELGPAVAFPSETECERARARHEIPLVRAETPLAGKNDAPDVDPAGRVPELALRDEGEAGHDV
jgi:hypothetical protein